MNEGTALSGVAGGVRKVVINACYGGFSLSPAAVRRLAEMEGRPCFFFTHGRGADGRLELGRFVQITEQEAKDAFSWRAFDVEDPSAFSTPDNWHAMTTEEKQAHNAAYEAHALDSREIVRDDPRLIQVIEELGSGHGEGASGSCAHLRIVEIPADAEWCIEEYDGFEHVAERHRTWR